MEQCKSSKIWNILSKYKFDVKDLPPSVICVRCRRILIDPYLTRCECHYCHDCIKGYIGNDRKHCLGGKPECSEEYLEMNDNVVSDIVGRCNLQKLSFKCPNETCSFKTKLENMEEHFRTCSIQTMACPFESIGCSNESMSKDNLNDHLLSETLEHAQLTVESLRNLKNDFERLSKILEMKENEIDELKIADMRNKRKIDDISDESERKKAMIMEVFGGIDRLTEVMTTVLEKEERISARMTYMEIEIKKELNEVKNQMGKIVDKSVYNTSHSFVEVKNTKDVLTKEENEQKGTKSESSEWLDESKEFFWSISDINHKCGWNHSDWFCRLGYMLQLRLYIYNCEYFFIEVNLMDVEPGSVGQWPFRHTITVNILNKHSQMSLKCWKLNIQSYKKSPSLFNKPRQGEHNKIPCEKIFLDDNPHFISDDTIVVSCSLSA